MKFEVKNLYSISFYPSWYQDYFGVLGGSLWGEKHLYSYKSTFLDENGS